MPLYQQEKKNQNKNNKCDGSGNNKPYQVGIDKPLLMKFDHLAYCFYCGWPGAKKGPGKASSIWVHVVNCYNGTLEDRKKKILSVKHKRESKTVS